MNKEEEILKLINYIVSGDEAYESESVEMDIIRGRKVDKQAKALAKVVSKIYRITHPLFSNCGHADWKKETEILLKHYKQQKE